MRECVDARTRCTKMRGIEDFVTSAHRSAREALPLVRAQCAPRNCVLKPACLEAVPSFTVTVSKRMKTALTERDGIKRSLGIPWRGRDSNRTRIRDNREYRRDGRCSSRSRANVVLDANRHRSTLFGRETTWESARVAPRVKGHRIYRIWKLRAREDSLPRRLVTYLVVSGRPWLSFNPEMNPDALIWRLDSFDSSAFEL